MPNQNKVNYNSSLADLQLANTMNSINKELNEDDLYEYYKVITTITSNLDDYLLGIYKPSFKGRLDSRLLLSDDFNKNMEEAINDINNAYEEINTLRDILTNNFNQNSIIGTNIKDELKKVKNEVDTIEDYLDEPNLQLVVAVEDFSNLDNINEDDTDAHIDLLAGQCTLARSNTINQNEGDAKVTILSESNGDKGNNHEAKVNMKAYDPGSAPPEEGTETEGKDEGGGFFSSVASAVGSTISTTASIALDPFGLVSDSAIEELSDIGSSIMDFFDGSDDESSSPPVEIPPNNQGDHISYKGEENNHSNIENIQGNNLDTWFEYEAYDLHDYIVNDVCHGYGFEYGDGTTWVQPPDNPDYLFLSLLIELPERKRINYLNIEPFIPSSEHESKGPKIKELILLEEDYDPEDDEQGHTLATEDDEIILNGEDESGCFYFSPMRVKNILLKLKRKDPYIAKIAHKFYLRVTSKNIEESQSGFGSLNPFSSSDSYSKTTVERVEGEVPTNPGQVAEDGGSGVNRIWRSKETETVTQDEVNSYMEYFLGHRWCIGLKDIGLYSRTYDQSSQIITREYTSPGSIREIKLEAQEYIPSKYYEETNDRKYDFINYYISIDGGSEWLEIAPSNSNRDGIKEYHINNMNLEETGKEDIENIELDQEINSVKVKIEIEQNISIEEGKYYSPTIRGFKLKMYSEM